jgi:hypothetical protein
MTSFRNRREQPVLNLRQAGQFVTIPGTDENDRPKRHHKDCFKCSVCEKPINDSRKGQSSFVLVSGGPQRRNRQDLAHSVVRERAGQESRDTSLSV